ACAGEAAPASAPHPQRATDRSADDGRASAHGGARPVRRRRGARAMSFQKAATLDDVWSGEKLGLEIGGRPVLLVNVGGAVCAYEDRCRHKGIRLSEGRLDGFVLTCAAHGWTYDARTGRGINPEAVEL